MLLLLLALTPLAMPAAANCTATGCLNGGTCRINDGLPVCDCSSPWTGRFCSSCITPEFYEHCTPSSCRCLPNGRPSDFLVGTTVVVLCIALAGFCVVGYFAWRCQQEYKRAAAEEDSSDEEESDDDSDNVAYGADEDRKRSESDEEYDDSGDEREEIAEDEEEENGDDDDDDDMLVLRSDDSAAKSDEQSTRAAFDVIKLDVE
eukprot:PLAT3511.2.p1 GENE.PLAT3511.2~~PLAT3511.2.p1  ORF type:complete len:204 (+),score=53.61 PLAT3511.2:25-636(+)